MLACRNPALTPNPDSHVPSVPLPAASLYLASLGVEGWRKSKATIKVLSQPAGGVVQESSEDEVMGKAPHG